MVFLGHEPGMAGWYAQMNLLSYGGTQKALVVKHCFEFYII